MSTEITPEGKAAKDCFYRLHDDGIDAWNHAAAAAIAAHEKTEWLDAPNEQGSWWFTRLDEDEFGYEEPFHINILWSGTSNTYFIALGQWGWTHAQEIDEMPGKWAKTKFPMPPMPEGRVGCEHKAPGDI